VQDRLGRGNGKAHRCTFSSVSTTALFYSVTANLLIIHSGSTYSGGPGSQMTATFITYLLQNGELQDHIAETLIPSFSRRHKLLSQAIEEHLEPLNVRMYKDARISGGYFIWVTLPEAVLADTVVSRAKICENLIIASGSLFEVWGDENAVRSGHCLRLCFAWETEENLFEGVRRLQRVIEAILGDSKH